MIRETIRVIGTLSLLIFITACGSHDNRNQSMWDNPSYSSEDVNLGQPFVLGAGDNIEVKFYYTPELNQKMTIRPDCFISMQLIDETKACGIQVKELTDILTKKYSGVLRDPELTVIVDASAGQNVYVGGEINQPGLFPIHGRMSALQAVIQAGGVKNTAELKNVVILRKGTNNKTKFILANLDAAMESSPEYKGVYLSPFDIVYVPKSHIAKLSELVSQYFTKLIPISYNVGYSWFHGI